MDEVLMVDGYNIIHAWNKYFNLNNESLEDCRDRLIHMLSNYQGYRKIKVFVVFDAYGVKGSKTIEKKADGLTVVYTGENESADHFIERYVYRMSDKHVIKVATSDYLQQRIVLHSGGIRMSPGELLDDVLSQNKKVNTVQGTIKIQKSNPIMNMVSKEILKILKTFVKEDSDNNDK